MKKGLLVLISFMLVLGIAFAEDEGEIIASEVRPDVVKWLPDTYITYWFTETLEVTYRKVDAENQPTGKENTVIFRNVSDNPGTPEDESTTEFTQAKTYIKNRMIAGDSERIATTKAVMIKLGL